MKHKFVWYVFLVSKLMLFKLSIYGVYIFIPFIYKRYKENVTWVETHHNSNEIIVDVYHL